MWSMFKRQEKKRNDTPLQSNINSFSTIVGASSSISQIGEEIRMANTLEALEKRVNLGIEVYAKMGPLRKKFAEDSKSTSNVVRARDHDEKLGSGYEELKRNFETIMKRLEAVPILQDQLQAVCNKVAQLSDVIEARAADGKNVQERIASVTDYTAPNSTKTLHSIPSNVACKPFPKPAVQSSRNLTVFGRASGTNDGTASTKAAVGKKPLKNKSSVATGKVSRVNKKLSLEDGQLPPREEKASGPGAATAVCVAETEEKTNVQDEHVRVDAEKPNGICDFLQNHPAPEWIELERKSNSTDNQCENVGSPAVTDKKCAWETRSDPVVDERHETIMGRPDVTAQSTSPGLQLILDRLDHLKKSQDTEKNEILAALSGFEKKIQEIDEKIDANKLAQVTWSKGSLDEKGSVCPEEHVKRTQNQSIVKIDNNRCHRGQQVSGEDITKCLEDRIDASYTRYDRPQPVIVNITFTGDKNDNAQSTCKSDRCVCVSETKEKSNVPHEYARVGAEKSNDNHVDRFKSKSHTERPIQFSNFSKTDEINEDGVEKVTKTNSDKKSVSMSTRLKCTNRFSSESVNNENGPKETQCEEHICSFLHNHPVPEWIRPKQMSSVTDNPCTKSTKIEKDCRILRNSKLFRVEETVNGSREKNEIVYEITQESQSNRNFNGSFPDHISTNNKKQPHRVYT